MKKVIYGLSIFIFMIIGISIVNADNGPTISGNTNVQVGEQTNLKATFPNSCLGRTAEGLVCAQAIVDVTSEVSWTSSDINIATINSSGIVTGVKEGNVKITAIYTHSDSTKVSSTYDMTVTKTNPKDYNHHMVLVIFNEENGQYDEITNKTWNIGKVGDTFTIKPKLCDITGLKSDNTYDESFCSDIDVIYTPNDPTIATVSNDGKITNLKEGETIIVVKTKEEITINTTPKVTETPTISLKVNVGETKKETENIVEKNNNVAKVNTPNTASTISIVAIIASVVLIGAAFFYYFAVINKLSTWKKE